MKRNETYKPVLDEAARGFFIQCHLAFFGLSFKGFDLDKVLLQADQFRERRVLLGIGAMESQVSCAIELACFQVCSNGSGVQKISDSSAYVIFT